ncbi:hypothetical protein EO98_06535 [Methanosarcina sp. 2.H.T.1A.6]|uniref:DegT/DnrJ/EryC1/StrS family aminotransferase n=1 Tax=unclassified Methanosarcina TaxID=2644672 RepID=UPI0006211F00|nr:MULTISPECIES: DegT/DnrJ/EryC1/StrS family aminotransferase [unclassified Methanosarcina]KKG18691.1 hypothetical protein EO94_19000 [Methanosarcina sp. 2.H.T.1A.3]KKG19545.1 hypothetical protein EO97_02825 [Methanosarcina sp. 2.H.T.1A.15]KKG21725.1 hypothetical protein EO98_06535 [Methanosarcina sp. 2.H.T.1A.6]KKG23720.1 hypothetical protein EO96_02785 [Methanosarcina sp. 2.H.T.1A.8]
MIPINKPLILKERKGSTECITQQLSQFLPNKHIYITFSARQGLDVIYKHLYKSQGTLNVAVSPLTCFEALYPIINNHHNIHFIDINSRTLNMNEKLIPDDVDVIQAIHFGGNPQDMDKITSLAIKNKQIVIEDCAQGFGSLYKNKFVGSFGEYSVFSFVKTLYGLAGGFVVSGSNLDLPEYKKLGLIPTYYRILKRILESKNSYNSQIVNFILYNCVLSLRPEDLSIFYKEYTVNEKIIDSIYSQLLNSEILLKKRIENAHYILDRIDADRASGQHILPEATSNYTRLYLTLENSSSKEVIIRMREKGVGANHLTQNSIEFYQNSIFENPYLLKFSEKTDLPNYREIHDRVLSLPVSPNLSEDEMDYITQNFNYFTK